MSVPSELLLNTQNSFQTHAQRGANIVMRGGKRKSRRKKGGVDPPAFLKGVAKRVSYRGKKKGVRSVQEQHFMAHNVKKDIIVKNTDKMMMNMTPPDGQEKENAQKLQNGMILWIWKVM